MKFSRWILIAAVVVVLLIGWQKLRYHASEFQGGAMRHSGTWFYPRYRAELKPFSLITAGEHEYEFSGLPSESFTLNLLAANPNNRGRRDLDGLETRLSVTLTDDAGKVLCSADATLKGGPNLWDRIWILAKSPTSSYLWTPKCVEMPIYRGRTYQMKVRVDSVDLDSAKTELIPILRAGGNELP